MKLILNYLKDCKMKLFIYIVLVISSYVPVLFSSYFFGLALENLNLLNFKGFLLNLSLWTIGFLLMYAVLNLFISLIYNDLEMNFSRNVSKDIYKKIDKLPMKAFEEISVGELINRLYTDPDRVMDVLSKIIQMFCKSIIAIFVFIVAYKASYILAIEIIIYILIMGIQSKYFYPKIKKSQEEIKKYTDKYVKQATENISGIREIKALGITNNIEKRIFETVDYWQDNNKQIKKYEVFYTNINNATYFILQFILLLTAGYFVVNNQMTYASFIMFQMCIWRLDDFVENISTFGVSYNKVKISLKRIDELINNKLYADQTFGKETIKNKKGLIEFKDIEFKYREDEELTLKGLNIKFEPNKKIAIIGRSGNGKSTIFNLLLRYFDSTNGEILIDGIDIKTLSEEELRNSISIIRQNPFIFNLSIKDNFQIVKENVTLEEIRKCCKKAYIDDYIMSLPKQYDTVIGEGGINLSGGQKQRLAIARTLLLNTKIILFDEATSALDNESQEIIKKTIDELIKNHTIIIVAHRLSTIIDADIINIIEDGKLENSGSHIELLEKSEVYRTLYNTEL